jgi:cysteine sulfinate desulfinase/cysteine desulfurase-like protein
MISSAEKEAYLEGEKLGKAFFLAERGVANKKILKGLEPIIELIGAKKGELIFFLSSYEELLLRLVYEILMPIAQRTGKNQVLIPKGEKGKIRNILITAGRLGLSFKEVETSKDGKITKEILQESIGPRTLSLCLCWAEKFTGAVHPVFEIANLCKEKEIFLYVDATETIGKVFFRQQDMQVDMLSFTHGNLTAVTAKKTDLMEKTKWGENFCLKEFFALSCFANDCLNVIDIAPMEYSEIKNEVMDRALESNIKCHFLNKGGGYLFDRWCFSFDGVNAETLAYFLREDGIFVDYFENRLSLVFSTAISKVQILQMWETIINRAKEIKEFSND